MNCWKLKKKTFIELSEIYSQKLIQQNIKLTGIVKTSQEIHGNCVNNVVQISRNIIDYIIKCYNIEHKCNQLRDMKLISNIAA